ncbi:MAG: hypothetical protein M1837_003903 [Sclerophora amabilis]|nr:MAG: hypothetical protein M1837_003903 [Sclerophora amabilis]
MASGDQKCFTTSSHIVPKESGLLAATDLAAGTSVLSVRQPLLTVVDTAHLQETCSNCFTWRPRSPFATVHDNGSESRPALKACLGCKAVRYCGKACQSLAWKRIHRYECKLFEGLQPRVLPTSVRAVLQILLRKDKGQLSAEQWSAILKLQSHIREFRQEGGRKLEGIGLMSKGAHAYSGTSLSEEFVQELYCKVLINSLTLVTPTFDPIGICVDPLAASINHSCNPNSVVVFDGPRLTVRSTHGIGKHEEITISYIDCTERYGWRQPELLERYFFCCGCEKCRREALTQEEDDLITVEDRRIDLTTLESEVSNMLREAKQKSSSGDFRAAIKLLKDALKILSNPLWQWPNDRQPSPSVRQQLAINHLAVGDWIPSAKQMLTIYFRVNPLLYPESWHPVRVVHNWTLATLILQLSSLSASDPGAVQELETYRLDYGKVVWGLLKEVEGNIDRSHGSDSGFAAQVRRKVEEVRVDMTRGDDASSSSSRLKLQPDEEWLEEEWTKLRQIAESVDL